MKKLVSIILIGVLAIGFGAISFADAFTSPVEIYSELAGVTVAEAYELKGTDKTFGDLAKEEGFWDEFVEATIAGKIAMVEARVADGTLEQEDADSIIEQLNDCDGTGDSRIGQFFMMAFGRNSEVRGNFGAKQGEFQGQNNENAPRYGQMNGTHQARMSNQSRDFSGMGSRFGQNR